MRKLVLAGACRWTEKVTSNTPPTHVSIMGLEYFSYTLIYPSAVQVDAAIFQILRRICHISLNKVSSLPRSKSPLHDTVKNRNASPHEVDKTSMWSGQCGISAGSTTKIDRKQRGNTVRSTLRFVTVISGELGSHSGCLFLGSHTSQLPCNLPLFPSSPSSFIIWLPSAARYPQSFPPS